MYPDNLFAIARTTWRFTYSLFRVEKLKTTVRDTDYGNSLIITFMEAKKVAVVCEFRSQQQQ